MVAQPFKMIKMTFVHFLQKTPETYQTHQVTTQRTYEIAGSVRLYRPQSSQSNSSQSHSDRIVALLFSLLPSLVSLGSSLFVCLSLVSMTEGNKWTWPIRKTILTALLTFVLSHCKVIWALSDYTVLFTLAIHTELLVMFTVTRLNS